MLYKRKIIKKIEKWLDSKEFIILNGPRQVGKTSILHLLRDGLLKNNISKSNIFYLNLEELRILNDLNKDPENLLAYITDKKNKNYFFIDEIQYLDNPSNFLKHIYDKYSSKIKIISTGSSNLELKAKLQDSLAGRKISFRINPLDFEEFLLFKNFPKINYLKKIRMPADIKHKFDLALEEYLIYGSMPAVVLKKNKEQKKILLEEYVADYINKDIRAIGKIDSISDFNNFLKVLASQIGGLVNINELSNTLGISRRHVEKYLELLDLTYVASRLAPFKKNIRTQITKMPKIYFFDLGIRNAIIGNFLQMSSRNCRGSLFENFIFMELKNHFSDIYFFRTVNKTEIDFVARKNAELYLFEVKFKNLTKKIDTRVMENFIKIGNNISKAVVVNKSFNWKEDGVFYSDYRNFL